jgi:AcrR family transcriptional regulator
MVLGNPGDVSITSSRPGSDRRSRRHHDSRDEVVETAVSVMAEVGAAGLSLGEVARRMGIRTPSLYVYFSSKSALCDEIFSRGWTLMQHHVESAQPPPRRTTDPAAYLATQMSNALAWVHENPGYAQLMFWRPIPNWEPTGESFGSAVAIVERLRALLRELVDLGLLARDTDVAEAADVWTVLSSGLVSQHLSNEPGAGLDQGRFGPLVGRVVQGFVATYASPTGTPRRNR